MTTRVRASSTQWGVGHGGFHTSEVAVDDDAGRRASLRYIYDCGSRASSARLRPSIDAYVARLHADHVTEVDTLYLSHFDADHVNGLTHLAHALTCHGISIRQVFAPLLTPLQRIGLVMTNAGDADYRALVLDPHGTLPALLGRAGQPPRVTLLPSTGSDEQAPELESDAPPADAPPPRATGPHVRIDRDGTAVVIDLSGAHARILWALTPFVTQTVNDHAADFWAEAQATFAGLSSGATPTNDDVERLLTIRRSLTRRLAWDTLGHDGSNLSSISLLSGPGSALTSVASTLDYRGHDLTHREARGAWLTTGDARLGDEPIVRELVAKLGSRMKDVAVVAAPHHGSAHNSGWEFWNELKKASYVTAQGMDTGKHPHPDVTREISLHGMRQLLVRDDTDSVTFIRRFEV